MVTAPDADPDCAASTLANSGMRLPGPPLNSETTIASTMPASSALDRNELSLAAAEAPRKFSAMTSTHTASLISSGHR